MDDLTGRRAFEDPRGVGITAVFEGPAGDQDRLAWALEQFDAAGLVIGSVDVVFFDAPEHCRGGAGLHLFGRTIPTVVVCNPHASLRHRTLLHELAHVWARSSLTVETRMAFLEARGLGTWCGTDATWSERGSEHAAEIIGWGVSDRPCWELPKSAIGDRDVAVLAAQYELLTGSEPRCDADAVRPNPHRYRQVIE